MWRAWTTNDAKRSERRERASCFSWPFACFVIRSTDAEIDTLIYELELYMTFDELLSDYRQRFPWHGFFELRKGEKIGIRAKEEGVPDKPGVYLVYGYKDGRSELLYIGKSGTLHEDGDEFSDQKLLRRITKGKQDGMPRRAFFPEQMKLLGLEALIFYWFVTFTLNVKVIPAKAEADLLQAYFDEYDKLPLWNKSI